MAGGAPGQGQGGGNTPSISPQTISDIQRLMQMYQQGGGQFGAPQGGGMQGQGGQPPQAPQGGDFIPGTRMPQAPQGPQVFNTMPYRIPDGTPPPQAPQQTFNTKPYNQGPAPVQNTGGPDVTGALSGGGMGFDRSGSDAGVGGQPVTQVQTPLQGQTGAMQLTTPLMGGQVPQGGRLNGGKPPMMSDFRPQKGIQIQGNPTEQPVYGGFSSRMR